VPRSELLSRQAGKRDFEIDDVAIAQHLDFCGEPAGYYRISCPPVTLIAWPVM
jgi:hypothetical protein